MEAVHTSHRLARSDPVSGSCVSRLYATCDRKPSVACVLTARCTPWEPRARRHSNTRAAVRAQRSERSGPGAAAQAHLGKQSCPEQNLRTTTSGVCLERACLHSRDLQQRGPRCVVEERGSHRLCPSGGSGHSPPGQAQSAWLACTSTRAVAWRLQATSATISSRTCGTGTSTISTSTPPEAP